MAGPWQDLYQAYKKGEIAPDVEIDFGGRKVKASEFFGEAERAYKNVTTWSERNAQKERELAAKEEELAGRGAAPPAAAPGAVASTEFADFPQELRYAASVDPYYRSLLTVLEGERKERQRVEREQAEWRTKAQQAWWTAQHMDTLKELKRENPDLDEATVVQYAQAHQIPNLRVAHSAMTRDDAVKRARDEGFQKGVEEGKKAGAVPFVPSGIRRPPIPEPAPDAPKDMQALRAKAEADPDVLKSFLADLEGAPADGG